MNTVTIKLTQGKFTVIDAEDLPLVSGHSWFAMKNGRHWCAGRNERKSDGKRATVYLHRQLMGFPSAEVDHRDRNGLNNRRSNLRLATDLQQAANRTTYQSRSGFRGVAVRGGRFEARINVNCKYVSLGRFTHASDAARVYDNAARKQFGEFAVLNFP